MLSSSTFGGFHVHFFSSDQNHLRRLSFGLLGCLCQSPQRPSRRLSNRDRAQTRTNHTWPNPIRTNQGSISPGLVSESQASSSSLSRVRWGGRLIQTVPHANQTCFEVLSFPLNDSGKPQVQSSSPSEDETARTAGGRFTACAAGFFDPSIYAPNRLVTVVGSVSGHQTRTIGQLRVQEPLVQAQHVHLWPTEPVRVYIRNPGFWSPYGPYGYRPFGYDPFWW